jgi:hypothetical protein
MRLEYGEDFAASFAVAPPNPAALAAAAAEAAEKINLDEAATRGLIDEQLRSAGWEADTVNLRYAKGARPVKGRNLAIAEWPTASGPADYALFAGLTLPVAHQHAGPAIAHGTPAGMSSANPLSVIATKTRPSGNGAIPR